jgi:hypothetical protein
MLSLVENLVESTRTVSSVGIQKLELAGRVFSVIYMLSVLCVCMFQGTRQPFVMETVKADDAAKLGTVCIYL